MDGLLDEEKAYAPQHTMQYRASRPSDKERSGKEGKTCDPTAHVDYSR